MSKSLFRFLPVVVGVIVGAALPFVGDAVRGPALLRPLLVVAVFGVGILGACGLVMAVSFPANVAIEPWMEAPPPDVATLLEAYRSLGFELSGPPLRVHIRPPGEIWVVANRELGFFGSIYATGTIPRRVGYDFSSILEGDRGELTSVADPFAAVMPLRPTGFKQLLRGASPAELLAFHRQGHDYLAQRGVRFADPGQIRAEDRVRASIARQRRVFLGNPIGVTALAIWRTRTGSTPYALPVAEQKRTEGAIRRVQEHRGQVA